MYIVNISGGQRIKWKLGKPRLEIGGLVCFVVQWKKRCKRSLSEDEIGEIIFYIERNYLVKKKDRLCLIILCSLKFTSILCIIQKLLLKSRIHLGMREKV